ncbi:hypothetical protein DI09_9p260 [Mitosporidium daphniae]|uniref:V-type proton ATPase proteolipid subunit n=1 Tax=Mitosporidium daphniae TaxID=1485682 RepID=A0A098VLK7_9MICR|nr:uncharacterized protein DI09_9p260 [Mitosporidium daphniae]KGG49943.1 hypothetical protein DI09_9p260 [Mitosporidium daphniae]|eukprot:XP_013236370.1 uncharacterized protein DI09_9p260 [Mitosporidium daphniae]
MPKADFSNWTCVDDLSRILMTFYLSRSELERGSFINTYFSDHCLHMISPLCPVWAPFLGALGLAIALTFCVLGAAYGTAKAGQSLILASLTKPNFSMKSLIPIIMVGVVALYGLAVSVLMLQGIKQDSYSLFSGCLHLSAGICTGLSGIACGFAIGIVADSGTRASMQQPKLFVPVLLILIFAEVLGLYGPIVGMLLIFKASNSVC